MRRGTNKLPDASPHCALSPNGSRSSEGRSDALAGLVREGEGRGVQFGSKVRYNRFQLFTSTCSDHYFSTAHNGPLVEKRHLCRCCDGEQQPFRACSAILVISSFVPFCMAFRSLCSAFPLAPLRLAG